MTIDGGDVLALLGAIALAAAGGELFLKGVLGAAEWLRLPKLLVATTLAAFATSSPELTVSTMAALSGQPEIGLGDALGSNVVNLALIMGLALLFGPLPATFTDVRRDFLLALFVPSMTLLLAWDGRLSRADGLALLCVFLLWVATLIRQAYQHRLDNPPGQAIDAQPFSTLLFAVVGITCLLLSGRLFVSGAGGIATALGIHSYVIGATVVAIGTSLPELVTTLLSRRRGHDDIGLGTLLGSNLFNGLAIVGLAASINPVRAPVQEIAITLIVGFFSVLFILPRGAGVPRWRAVVLLATYAAYIATTARMATFFR